MKRNNFRAIVSLLIVAVMLLLTVSCGVGKVDGKGSATVVIAAGDDRYEYEVPLSEVDTSLGAVGLLEYLKAEKGVDYTSEDLGYGAYLTKVGALEQDASAGVYVGIWTSVESDMDRESQYSTAITYRGTELVSAAVGMSSLNVPDGAVIYFGELKY